eukprot:1195123-Prorocentrum_minimum.AAC.3
MLGIHQGEIPVAFIRFAGEALDPPPAPEQGARSRPGQGLTRNRLVTRRRRTSALAGSYTPP